MDEQRLFLRKKVPLPLPIELLPGKEVWLHDLGEGGLSVSGSSRLELGTATFFKFQFPDANSLIEAAGVVAWCDGSGRVGIRFTRIKPDSSAVLKRWLKSEERAADQNTGSAGQSGQAGLQPPRAHNEIADLRAEISAANLGSAAALNLIVERMLRLTRATGAAIALREGEDVICCASSGAAPDLGAQLNLDASVTGKCYRTGKIVSITDAENDSRVDAELCRQLQFRSLLIVPVTKADDVIGVAEVFSPVAGNFEGGDILLLGSIADIIAEIYQAQQDEWTIPAVKLAYDIPILAQSVTTMPASAESAIEAPVLHPTSTTRSVTDFREERNTYKSDAPQTSGSGQTIDAGSTPENQARGNDPADQTKSARSWKPPTYLLLVLLAVVGIAIGNYSHRHPISRWARARPHQEAGPVPSSPADLNPPMTNGTLTGKNSAVVVEKLQISRMISTPKQALLKKSISSDGPAHSNLRRISANDVQLEEQLPSAPTLSPSLASDATPVAAAQLTPAKLLHRVEPIFPDFAREAGLDGTILLSAIIARDGRLKEVKLVSGNRALATEAFRALREWRYRPYLLDGKPIEVETRIVMNFHR